MVACKSTGASAEDQAETPTLGARMLKVMNDPGRDD